MATVDNGRQQQPEAHIPIQTSTKDWVEAPGDSSSTTRFHSSGITAAKASALTNYAPLLDQGTTCCLTLAYHSAFSDHVITEN